MDNNITSDISAGNASLEANDQKQSKGEPPIHLEWVHSPPSVDLDGEHGPKGTNSHVCCDPKDPQNWPEWKKNVQILMVSFHSLSSTFMTAGIVPATHTFSEQYGVSLSKASYLASAQVCFLSSILSNLIPFQDPPTRCISHPPLERYYRPIRPLPCASLFCPRRHGM